LEDLSAPLPIEEPGGSGAGIKPQFSRRIFNASTQYFSHISLVRSVLSAAALKLLAAFLSASSFPEIVSCELNASTEEIGTGFETIVEVKT
jgi:hypothetical protein